MTQKDNSMMNAAAIVPAAASDVAEDAAMTQAFKAGMRRHAAGVTLITTIDHGTRYGLVATAVSSVSTDPPTLLICVNKSASAHDAIDQSGVFCVNVLGVDAVEIASQFANSSRRDERFTTGHWTSLSTGAPVLEEAVAAFDCAIVERIPYGSHTIFLGRVQNVRLAEDRFDPLVYVDRGYHRLLDT